MNRIKTTLFAFAALALAAGTFACDKKDNAESGKPAQGAAERPSSGTANAAAPAPQVKLVALDLTASGDDDFKGLSIQAPEGAKAKSSLGIVVAKEPSFQIEVHKEAAKISDRKGEIKKNDMNKLKRFLVESDTALVYETQLMGKSEFHFVGNVKVGGADFYCEDVKGPTFTQGDVETMWKACQTLAPAQGAAAAAPASAAPAAAAPSGDIFDQAYALLEDMTNILQQNQNDCDKMAAGLKKHFADNADTYKKMKDAEKTQTKAQKKAFDARTKGFEKKLEGPIAKCANNKGVMDAMSKAPL